LHVDTCSGAQALGVNAAFRPRLLYWRIGEYINDKLAAAEWGEGVVDSLAQHLARTEPGLRGFSAQNLWRMRQLFETCRDAPKLSPLVRALPWTHNLIILELWARRTAA
jgi:DUF1016 N-terminal domain